MTERTHNTIGLGVFNVGVSGERYCDGVRLGQRHAAGEPQDLGTRGHPAHVRQGHARAVAQRLQLGRAHGHRTSCRTRGAKLYDQAIGMIDTWRRAQGVFTSCQRKRWDCQQQH